MLRHTNRGYFIFSVFLILAIPINWMVVDMQPELPISIPSDWYENKSDGSVRLDTTAATEASADKVEFSGHVGGMVLAVETQNEYAYVGQGGVLSILDISVPADLNMVGYTRSFPDIVQAVAVEDDFAYIADNTAGLLIIDISNPAEPIEVGAYDTPGYASDVAVMDGYGYVADYFDGLRVVDISNPTSPNEVGFFSNLAAMRGVAISGDYAFVANDYLGLQVVDISNPAVPVEVGNFDTPGEAYDVALSGNYAFVADTTGGLRIIDISTPSSPVEVGYTNTLGKLLL